MSENVEKPKKATTEERLVALEAAVAAHEYAFRVGLAVGGTLDEFEATRARDAAADTEA